jgi:microcystin degradation protein MlrC
MTEAIRIAVLNFVHETVTFLPNDTTLDDFVHDGSPARGEALLAWEPRSYMGGFVKVAREHAGVELVGIESPLWPRTGTGSGWITREAYEHFLGRMLAELERGGRWPGVYLALHGAMGVRGVARPEADIARRVREVVGRDAFIAGTFDPREILPALRQPPAGRARGSHADPRHPPRLHPRRRHGEGADPERDGAAMDWRFTVDGPGPARPGLGSA